MVFLAPAAFKSSPRLLSALHLVTSVLLLLFRLFQD